MLLACFYTKNKIYISQLPFLIHKTCNIGHVDLTLAAGNDIINRHECSSGNEDNFAIMVKLVISQSLLKTALQSFILITPVTIQQRDRHNELVGQGMLKIKIKVRNGFKKFCSLITIL